MRRKKLFKCLLLPGMLSFCFHGMAQDHFAYGTSLDSIGQAGFYRIVLTPEIVSKGKQDLSDIRIRDAHGQFTPYVFKSDFPFLQGESFIEFPVLSGDSAGEVRIGNWSGGSINSLLLYIKSNNVLRHWTLSGSDDGKKWFIIKEHIPVSQSTADNSDRAFALLTFPPSDYHYFKIIQEDKGVLPLNIYRAGIKTQHTGNKRYRQTPVPAITRKDSSNHHSYVTLTFKEPYLVEHVDLSVRGPKLYKREVHVLIKEEPYRDERLYLDPVSHSFDAVDRKVRSFTLDIDNEDNTPLVIDRVETSQLERYLLTWLEPGSYRLLVGDSLAKAPRYDLRYFTDTVSREPAEIVPGVLTAVNNPTAPQPVVKDRSGVWLWSIILAVLALMVFLSLKMLKAIPGHQQKEDSQ